MCPIKYESKKEALGKVLEIIHNFFKNENIIFSTTLFLQGKIWVFVKISFYILIMVSPLSCPPKSFPLPTNPTPRLFSLFLENK